jgi:mRNA interferase MazF
VKRGDVVLMVVPSELGRPRPGVIVQADELGSDTTSVLVCPMSSDLTEFGLTRPVIEPSPDNGLRVRSQIMTEKLLALRRERIRRVIGTLDTDSTEILNSTLLIVLGLADNRRA